MDEPSSEDRGLDDGVGDGVAIPRPLAGNALLKQLRLELDGVDFGMLRAVESSSDVARFQYRWCEPMNVFLGFLARHLKTSVATSFHDAVKYLIFRIGTWREGAIGSSTWQASHRSGRRGQEIARGKNARGEGTRNASAGHSAFHRGHQSRSSWPRDLVARVFASDQRYKGPCLLVLPRSAAFASDRCPRGDVEGRSRYFDTRAG